MQTNNKNKMIDQTQVKTKEEFFFAGGLEYLPQTIVAESREEAERTWLETRKSRTETLQDNL